MSLGLCADALRAQQRAIDTLFNRATPEARNEGEGARGLPSAARRRANGVTPPPAALRVFRR